MIWPSLIPPVSLDAWIGVDDTAIDGDGGADHVITGARSESNEPLPLFENAARQAPAPDAGSPGSARGPRAPVGGPPTGPGARYSHRRLPHFEHPWAIYAIAFSTRDRRRLSPRARDLVLDCILHWKDRRYLLLAACIMPDHVHLLTESMRRAFTMAKRLQR